jgi:hypothetical protein
VDHYRAREDADAIRRASDKNDWSVLFDLYHQSSDPVIKDAVEDYFSFLNLPEDMLPMILNHPMRHIFLTLQDLYKDQKPLLEEDRPILNIMKQHTPSNRRHASFFPHGTYELRMLNNLDQFVRLSYRITSGVIPPTVRLQVPHSRGAQIIKLELESSERRRALFEEDPWGNDPYEVIPAIVTEYFPLIIEILEGTSFQEDAKQFLKGYHETYDRDYL